MTRQDAVIRQWFQGHYRLQDGIVNQALMQSRFCLNSKIFVFNYCESALKKYLFSIRKRSRVSRTTPANELNILEKATSQNVAKIIIGKLKKLR
jgi:hypothetical protein